MRMTYAQAQDYLYALKTQKSTYGLERMERLVARIGRKPVPCIHVAGTNGKGSVCAMLESIYRSAGYRTGLYTSPHLVYLGERVQVNRQSITPEELSARIPALRAHAEAIAAEDPAMHPSFFEFMTALALDYFSSEAVDVAIIETGLGGRLDATSVVEPNLCVITSIALDHAEILGDTLEVIAREKAGIIKEGVPVLLGNLPEEAKGVIEAIAQERSAPVYYFNGVKDTALKGRHQQINAGIANRAVELLQSCFPVTQEHVCKGLSNVVWEGRWQTLELKDGKNLILDATHNAEGARYLDENLAQLVEAVGKISIIAGTTGDARSEALMPVVATYAKEIHLVRPSQERAASFDALEKALPDSFEGECRRAILAKLFPKKQMCALGKTGDTLVVTGSLYLIGEVMAAVLPDAPTNGARLQDF